MLTAPFSGTQLVYVAIKQVVSLAHKHHLNAQSPERARVCAGSTVQKATVSKLYGIFSATTESEEPLLKELQHAAIPTTTTNVAKLCFYVSRIPFQPFSGFTWM